ncbi:dephospho-CoA kinase [Hymenobacter humi]|uniref:Dephospho-CoA kinase n=1 Tax=Hymenobacter humi TaxID=1411620 RepID=A0ABW2U172_9BACT
MRQARVLQRDSHRSLADVLAIMGKQLSEEEKIERADYVLTNDNVHPLLPQVLALHAIFSRPQGA